MRSKLQLTRSILITLANNIQKDIDHYFLEPRLEEDMKEYIETLEGVIKDLKQEEKNISKHIKLKQD